MGFDGVGGDVEGGADLSFGQIEIEAEEKALTLPGGQLFEGGDQSGLFVIEDYPILGGFGRGGRCERLRVAERHEAPAVVIPGQVEEDRPEVGRRPVRVANPVRRAVQPYERLLHQVFGGVAVVREKTGQAYQRRTFLREKGTNEAVGIDCPLDRLIRGCGAWRSEREQVRLLSAWACLRPANGPDRGVGRQWEG